MPWFWGKKATNDHAEEGSEGEDDESYDSEEYTDEEDEDEEAEVEDDDHDDEQGNAKEDKTTAGDKETAATTAAPTPAEATRERQPSEVAAAAAAAAAAASSLQATSTPTTTPTIEKDHEHDPDEYHLQLKPAASGPPGHSAEQEDDDDDVSSIHSEGHHSGDDSYLDTTDEDDDDEGDDDDDDEEEDKAAAPNAANKSNGVHNDASALHPAPQPDNAKKTTVRVETVGAEDEDTDDDDNNNGRPQDNDDDGEEEEAPTSFWEKQSLLALAAEHDRVDILKGILADDDQNATNELMDSGVPPLHIAISFGSVNATQSLLRMGADPSIRPDVVEIKKQAQEAPEGSKLEIPNMARFDGVTAWELAFGNAAYEEHQRNHRPSWSMFHGSSSSQSISSSARADRTERIIKPVDMPPSKREGIRHAFTAEALRCIGADEVHRLKQLLNSGMPASIDVGGKDLYDWSVQLGGLQCEEFLRPIEAAKHGEETTGSTAESTLPPSTATPTKTTTSTTPEAPPSVGKVLDRPGEEMTVPLLINRLDELESLATALSTCLDNLAEEVSVCHGLLLLGGGASALAAHVKSLKTLQEQKRILLFQAQQELDHAEHELVDLVRSSGPIGQEVIALAPTMFLRPEYSRAESFRNKDDNRNDNDEDDSSQRQQLLAQIAASENKILKLRASIADLSEENAKEMEQVERRGLTGGINLVRTLREELRDLDYQCSETKNRLATCRAQIAMIHSRLPKQHELKPTHSSHSTDPSNHAVHDEGIILEHASKDDTGINSNDPKGYTARGNKSSSTSLEVDTDTPRVMEQLSTPISTKDVDSRPTPTTTTKTTTTTNAATKSKVEPSKLTWDRPIQAIPGRAEVKRTPRGGVPPPSEINNDDNHNNTKSESERIANGESTALAIRPSGNRGFFTVDLWQVILRIMGLDDAANRRGARMSQKQKGTSANLMIV